MGHSVLSNPFIMLLPLLIVLALGYLIGSIPVAVLIGHWHKVDILNVGSGNAGATNINRTLGKRAGYLCFALDALKGVIATSWVLWLWDGLNVLPWLASSSLLAAVIGHRFSVWIKFRGGKGVATTTGGLLVLLFYPTIIGLALWAFTFFALRYVSLASIVFALSLPITSYLYGVQPAYVILALVLSGLLILSHHSNIKRLWQGKEHRF